MSRRTHLILLLVVSLGLRLLVWWILPYRDYISDEAEYLGAAAWLAAGRGFSFFDTWIWTRPPLYVLFLAAHVVIWGPANLWPIRFSQALLGTLIVYLITRLGEALAPNAQRQISHLGTQDPGSTTQNAQLKIGLAAGWMAGLAYTFISYPFFLLSETLFLALFLTGILLLVYWAQQGAPWQLIGGGVFLALTVLTKTLVLMWLPFAALWVAWVATRKTQPTTKNLSSLKRALTPAALLTVVICALVLPWSAYATQRWGGGHGVILIDTTGGYNFALGAQVGYKGARDEKALHKLLCGGIHCEKPQAQRQLEAYKQGWEWIQKKPSGFLKKTGLELLDMIQLNYDGAERLTDGYTLGFIPLPHLLGLFLGDTLYVVVLILSTLGLWRSQERLGKGLVVSWLLYNVAVGALIFAINRFSIPLLPFLFIYAAIAITQRRNPWPSGRRRLGYTTAALLLIIVLPSYLYWPPTFGDSRRAALQDTWLGLQGLRNRMGCEAVETAFKRGDLARANQLHDEIDAHKNLTCLAYLKAQLLEREGKPEAALELLQRIAETPQRYLLEGDIYRRQGNIQRARGAFVAQRLEPANPTEWAWEHLQPPVTTTIDLGGGLDWGYIDGFYEQEDSQESQHDPFGPGSYRWLGPQGRLRFVGAGTGKPQILALRVNGYRDEGWEPAYLSITHKGQQIWEGTAAPGWQVIEAQLPPVPQGSNVIVELRSSIFVPSPDRLAARQAGKARSPLQLFGVQIDWAELRGAATGKQR